MNGAVSSAGEGHLAPRHYSGELDSAECPGPDGVCGGLVIFHHDAFSAPSSMTGTRGDGAKQNFIPEHTRPV